MKYFFFFFTFLAGNTCCNAQQYIYITITSEECANCLNQAVYLDQLTQSFKKVFIFEKRYLRDASFVLNKYGIQAKDSVVWSDSLYQAFKNNDKGYSSSVAFYNPENGKILKTQLVHLSQNLNCLNAYYKDEDTLHFKDEVFGSSPFFNQTGNSFYFFNYTTKSLSAYDKLCYAHRYDIKISDSLIQHAYQLKYGNEWERKYALTTDFCRAHRRQDQNMITSYYPKGDSLYVLAQHNYLYFTKADTNQVNLDTNTSVFLTLTLFVNGYPADQGIFENYLDFNHLDSLRGIKRHLLHSNSGKAHYNLTGNGIFIDNEGKVYAEIIGGYHPNEVNHFLAKYEQSPEGNFVFISFYNKTLPEIYNTLKYNNVFPPFKIPYAYPYFTTNMSDYIFSVDSERHDIEVGYFDKIAKIKLPQRELSIWDLKVSPQYVYMVYMNMETKYYNFLKWDRITRQAVVDKRIQRFDDPSTFITTPMLDDFDYNYVYIPLSENSILRKKFGE